MRGREGGGTLLEVAIALAVLSVALGAIYGTVRSTFRTMLLAERTLEIQQNARIAVDRMVEEIRWGEAVLPDPGCGGLCPDRITVRIAPHNPRRPGQSYVVTFRRDSAQGELERRLGPAVNNLAGFIASLTFRYFNAAGAPATQAQEVVRVEVAVSASTTAPLPSVRTITTDVFLRNH